VKKKMIRVSGSAKLKTDFTVDLNMTEEEFDALTQRQQDQLLEDNVDWYEASRQAEVDDIDVDDLEKLEEQQK